MWSRNSVNQAALILLAKSVPRLLLDEVWNCKHAPGELLDPKFKSAERIEPSDCRVFHHHPDTRTSGREPNVSRRLQGCMNTLSACRRRSGPDRGAGYRCNA